MFDVAEQVGGIGVDFFSESAVFHLVLWVSSCGVLVLFFGFVSF